MTHRFSLLFVLSLLLLFVSSFAEVQEYILMPGDVISVSVVEHPEFSGRHKIRPDGRINYPVIGEIDVASLTCAQLVKIMEGKLAAYVNNPVVSVAIEAYYANKIYIIGDVNGGSGQYEIYEPVDIQKAIAMCGGLKNTKTKVIKIIRADGKMIDIAMSEVWTSAAKQKYIMYPGDTMYVPPSFQVPWAMLSTILSVISTGLSIVVASKALSK
jgi:polysaccharide export outer membrane protein